MENDKKVTLELTVQEITHLHLSVVSRSAFVTQMWASCVDEKEQDALAKEVSYLNGMVVKLQSVLKDVLNNGK